MADRDLTPAEAKQEVEVFLGDGWSAQAWPCESSYEVSAGRRNGVALHCFGPTYRAAVSALKAAWRDAVRPAAERGVVFGLADLHHSADPAVVQQEYAKRIPFLTSLSLGEEA